MKKNNISFTLSLRHFVLFGLACISLFTVACGDDAATAKSAGPTINPDPDIDTETVWTETTANTAAGRLFPIRANHTSVVFNNAMWVIGGLGKSIAYDNTGTSKNDVWKSTDGINWSREATADFIARNSHTSVVFDDGSGDAIWVIGGFHNRYIYEDITDDNGNDITDDDEIGLTNDVWKSTDGKSWTQVSQNQFPGRSSHTSVVFDDGFGKAIWVIGGYDGTGKNDVWKSTDGKSWTSVNSAAAFTPRYGHTSVVFDKAMWVIGGLEALGGAIASDKKYVKKNDVWKSTDGKNWIQVNSVGTKFSERMDHSTIIMKDGTQEAMLVIGGTSETPSSYGGNYVIQTNEVWQSIDGINWTEDTSVGTKFPKRHSHSSVVFDDGSGDSIWVIGGDTYVQVFQNDVWRGL